MATTDPRVDAYIAKSADFAKPILTQVRAVVRAACPSATETIKWGKPSWIYGKGILCGVAAFKAHCSLGFWKGAQIEGLGRPGANGGMGHFGRLTSVADLPSQAALTRYIKAAMRLNEPGAPRTPSPMTPRKPKAPLRIPTVLTAALKKNRAAMAAFTAFSPSHQREYVEWITDAKTDETRRRRIDTAIEWLTDGKPRNWKYMKT